VATASAATTANIPTAAWSSRASLPVAKPLSISLRTPWPSTSTRPPEASSAAAAPAARQAYGRANGRTRRSALNLVIVGMRDRASRTG
jgi:hypothetical protein